MVTPTRSHAIRQVSEIANLGVYWLFLILCRPYDDTIFMTYEIITNTAQLAMLIVIILGYYELIETPKGAFIGLIAFILLGQILTQVRSPLYWLSCRQGTRRRRLGSANGPLTDRQRTR